jgi:dienelactone hydrolase
MFPSHLRAIADSMRLQAAGAPIVIVGHSAGAAAGVYITARLRYLGADVRGLVIVDGVDSPNHLIRRNLSKLSGLRIAAVLAPPSPCNRQGLLATDLREQPEVRVEIVPGAGHGDIEGAGISMYRRVCKDSSSAETAARFRDRVRASVEWVLGEA